MAVVRTATETVVTVTRTVRTGATTVVTDTYTRSRSTVDYTGRMALKLERLLDEAIQTLAVARPVMITLAKALDEGLLEDVLTALRQVEAANGLMGKATRQLDSMLPLLDATAPLTGIVNSSMNQVSNLPGVRRVRQMTRGRTVDELEIDTELAPLV